LADSLQHLLHIMRFLLGIMILAVDGQLADVQLGVEALDALHIVVEGHAKALFVERQLEVVELRERRVLRQLEAEEHTLARLRKHLYLVRHLVLGVEELDSQLVATLQAFSDLGWGIPARGKLQGVVELFELFLVGIASHEVPFFL
jgi:hypothetical protein